MKLLYDNDIFIAAIAGTILFFILILFIVSYFILYKKRRTQHKMEIQLTKDQFQEELLKTEFEVQENTRKNLASDLHDNIGQVLSLTNVTLASINLDDKDKARQKIADTQALVTRSIRELRQLSKIIHGEQLIKQGLVPTIEQEITWLQRNGHYTIQFDHDLTEMQVSNIDKDLFMYRLLQESLNNIIKHSGANQIEIQLKFDDNSLLLSVTDNGTGFNVDEKMKQDGGLGLLNMQKRIAMLNGSLEIESAEDKGTSITFTIPYP